MLGLNFTLLSRNSGCKINKKLEIIGTNFVVILFALTLFCYKLQKKRCFPHALLATFCIFAAYEA
jgi:hypothetical protein